MSARQPAWERLRSEWSVLYEPLPERTAPYEALLARREELAPATDGYEASKLAREHAVRVAYWSERLGTPDPEMPQRRRTLALHDLERLMVIGGSIAAVLLIGVGWRTSWPVALVGSLGLAGTVAALLLATRRAGRPLPGDALRKALCPDCGYDLSGLPSALPHWAVAGSDVGPAACPECGSPWPRVPPPAPRVIREDVLE
ncbi:MAG: hypothetical protein IPJ41_07715 [Phycisphaerales bacterium]|nr:hypothetical protein [Phycisphaerales bacterium]